MNTEPNALTKLFAKVAPPATKPQVLGSSTIKRPDMPESVLDGRLGEICQRRLKHLPLAYSWGALVTTAGAMIPRGAASIRTNLFWCPVGPPGSGKSQSQEACFQIAGLTQSTTLLKAKFGSAEALVERLEDIGADAVRLVFVDEMGHLLSKAAIDRSSFPYILNTAYYEDRQAGGSKGRQFNFDCRLSICGGVVEEIFGDSFGAATTGGLYDRFIFGLCPQPYQYLYRPFEGGLEPIKPFAASADSDVWDARDEWVRNGISPRVAEHALRVAYICACVDGRPSLRASDLSAAHAFAQYQTRVRVILAPNPGENPDARCATQKRSTRLQ
jgi:hypothetical protein